MGQLPAPEVVAELRNEQKKSFVEIGKMYGATRQAAHKAYKKWAEKKGVNWRTRTLQPTATPDA